MKRITININGIQNAQKYLNDFLTEMYDQKHKLLDVTCEGDNVQFSFAKGVQCRRERMVVRQFSKKKYSSAEEGFTHILETQFSNTESTVCNWKNILTIEQQKYWLVFFKRE